jgi:UDP-glucose 4-epimerase
MRILITGICGFVGSSLAHIFSEDAQLDVHGVDDLSFGYQERLQGIENKITFHENDVDTYCSSHSTKFDMIINAAAVAPLPDNQVNHNRSLAINVGTVGSLIDFMIKTGCRRMLHFSSSAVYEGLPSKITSGHEIGQRLDPHLMYPISKYLSEVYLKAQAEVYGLDIIALRLFNLYGPRQDYFRKQTPLLGYLIKNIIQKKPVMLFASPKAKRDYVYILDLINFIKIIMNQSFIEKRYKAVNIGSGSAYSVYDLVEKLEEISGEKLVYTKGNKKKFWDKYPSMFENRIPLPEDIVQNEVDKVSFCNLDQTIKQFKWSPEIKIESGLKMCFDYAKKIIHA